VLSIIALGARFFEGDSSYTIKVIIAYLKDKPFIATLWREVDNCTCSQSQGPGVAVAQSAVVQVTGCHAALFCSIRQ
jgi:hypothetical protein